MAGKSETPGFARKIDFACLATYQGKVRTQNRTIYEHLKYLRENVNPANSYDSATLKGPYTMFQTFNFQGPYTIPKNNWVTQLTRKRRLQDSPPNRGNSLIDVRNVREIDRGPLPTRVTRT
jgi:hypothetical protein